MVRPAGAPDNVQFEDDNYLISINDTQALRVSTTDAVLANTLNSASLSHVVLSGANAAVGGSGDTVGVQISASQHFVLADASAANLGFGLPPASASVGQTVTIKRIDASSNLIFLSGFVAAERIDGNTFMTLNYQSSSLTVISDGGQWHIISSFSGGLTPV